MIQLASDPNARLSSRSAANDGKSDPFAQRRGRTGHAWPFISRHSERPLSQTSSKTAAGNNGS